MKCLFLVLLLVAVVHCIPLDDDDDNARKVEWQNFNPANMKENRYPNHHDKEKEKDGEKKKPQKGSAKPQNGSAKPQNGSGKPQKGSGKPQNGSGKPQKGSDKPQKGSDKPQKGSDKPQKGSEADNNPQVGGSSSDVTNAYINQFPELIYVKVSDSVPCQGSLITPQAILTSASCFWNIGGSNNSITSDPTMIAIGKPEALTISIDATMEVMNVTICPEYRYYPLSMVHENNLAIVLLKKPVTVWKNITVAGSSTGKPDGHSKVQGALLAGWGMITNPANASDPQATTQLKFAKVLVASQKACAAQYAALNASSVYLLGNSMLCSNVTATKTSSCQGDEGSSLRYLDIKTQVPVLFAIASPPVETMCPTTLHSLYTNVGAHTKWINSVTGLKIK